MPRPIYFISALLALGGCASLPPLSPARVAHPISPNALPETADGAFPADAWWQQFGDPGLDATIAAALAHSPDLDVAAARLRSAEALAIEAGAANWPQANLEASGGGNKQSYNNGIPRAFLPQGVVDNGRIAGNFGFNIDLWGRNRAALAAATSDAAAARVDAAQARLLLTTAVAAAWIEYAQRQTEVRLAQRALDIRERSEGLTLARQQQGVDTLAEVRLAQSRSAQARGELAALEEMRVLTQHRINALIGANPDASLPIPKLNEAPEIAIPAQISLNLLGRRPDLVAARLRSEAIAARVRVARTAFYPNINLVAVAGLQSLGLSALFDSGSSFASFGPALSIPVFDGGRLAARYRGIRATYDEAVARYDATLIDAVHEIADVLASQHALDARLADARVAQTAAREARGLAELRYRNGLFNQLQLLTAEDQALAAERSVAALEVRRLALTVALVRALGGGFSEKLTTGPSKS